MKISLNWAKHWTSSVPAYTPSALSEFSHTYSTHTAEVEGIDSYIFDDLIVVGHVLDWQPHPDSDKLGLVQVDTGIHGIHQIVCGAPNAKTTQYAPVAMENAVLPGGLHITRRSIRGIDSCGMICSLDELGLQSERAEGIFPLETVWDSDLLEKYVGQPFGYLTLSFPCNGDTISYRLNDVVFDLDNKFITNRPDLFSVVGNAREIACIGKTPFSYPPYSIHPREDFFGGLSVSIQSDKVINYFLTKYSFESITETPFVLKVLLKRSNQGLHGILPDITNLVLNELGQPSHVFDADIIVGDIVVRPALSGETLVALDNKTYTLTPEDLVIADSEKILAIAGVIGGLSSSATDKTRNILIETATFDPVTVRRMSQRLGVRTDSSVRFEKGTDVSLPLVVQNRIHELLSSYATGLSKIASFCHYTTPKIITIEISHELFEKKIGVAVQHEDVSNILTRLGFIVAHDQSTSRYSVTVPSWRSTGDVDMAADIIEEVARHVGYDTIPAIALPGPLSTAQIHSHDTITLQIASFFAHKGYFDAYTYPFTLSERFNRFSDTTPAIIQNTSENRTHLRAHLAENLLELVASHYRNRDCGAFFEFGSIFDGSESLQGAGVVWGSMADNLRAHLTSYMMTFFGSPGVIIQGSLNTKLFAPHAYGEILISQKDQQQKNNREEESLVAIRFGLVRPTLLPLFDISGIDVYAFEIIKLPDIHRSMKFMPLVEYPGTRRELNFIIPESTPVYQVITILATSHQWVSDIGVSEVYRDSTHIGEDKKSVVVSFLIQNPSATITDEEAGKIQESIVTQLATAGYKLRGA